MKTRRMSCHMTMAREIKEASMTKELLCLGILSLATMAFIAYELYVINHNIMEIAKFLEKEAKK